jgi:hypothetical protein
LLSEQYRSLARVIFDPAGAKQFAIRPADRHGAKADEELSVWSIISAAAIMEAMGEVIFWLEVIWTSGLALSAYLLLPRPED